jgi:hypothetical protein
VAPRMRRYASIRTAPRRSPGRPGRPRRPVAPHDARTRAPEPRHWDAMGRFRGASRRPPGASLCFASDGPLWPASPPWRARRSDSLWLGSEPRICPAMSRDGSRLGRSGAPLCPASRCDPMTRVRAPVTGTKRGLSRPSLRPHDVRGRVRARAGSERTAPGAPCNLVSPISRGRRARSPEGRPCSGAFYTYRSDPYTARPT